MALPECENYWSFKNNENINNGQQCSKEIKRINKTVKLF